MPRKRRSGPDIPDRLDPFDGGDLEPGGDYEAVEFVDVDFAGLQAPNVRFLACRWSQCGISDAELPRATLRDVAVRQLRTVATDLSESSWIEVEVEDSALAGTQLFDGAMQRVTFRNCKLDAVNLRGAKLTDVRFEGCVLTDADFGAATLRRTRFDGCRVEGADFSQATLDEVDLRGSEITLTRGYESLGGAIIDSQQLVILAPAIAEHLGITIRDD